VRVDLKSVRPDHAKNIFAAAVFFAVFEEGGNVSEERLRKMLKKQ
jgi:hypothetical protein